MEQININKIEQLISDIKEYTKNNSRLEELFTTQPQISMSVYKKTTIFYAEKKFEEHEKSKQAIPHGFYQILEQEINQNGVLKTIKKYDKEITLISEVINIPKKEIIKTLSNLKLNNKQNIATTIFTVSRNYLKEIIRKFTAKYKEEFIKRIIDEKLNLLEQNITRKKEEKSKKLLPIESFIDFFINTPALIEALSAIIIKKLNIYPTTTQLKETLRAVFDEDYIESLKAIYKIAKPPYFKNFEENKVYDRLKRNYEPKLNKLFTRYTMEQKEQLIQILELKKKIKLYQGTENLEINTIKRRLKAAIPHDDQILLEEISNLMAKCNCSIKLINNQFIFDFKINITKEEIKECKNYIKLEKYLKSIHNFIYPYYEKQNKLVYSAVSKTPTPLSSNEEDYQINTDFWLTKEKIIQAISAINIDKLNQLTPENFALLKDFLIEKGFLWAYIADNIELNTFAKIINNFSSIIACCSKEELTIDNIKEIIKKANLYDYANDLIIGLIGTDIAAKVINYNQFSGTNVTDEVIKSRLRKVVDLSVRSERIKKSSLPFNCNVKYDNLRLLRYRNNDPTIFTSGIDTKTCFFISVNENDFFFYSLLNKNGYVIKIVDKDNNLLARATCFRRNNILMINGIRCKNNKVISKSQEETKEMIQIVNLIKLMAQKMIELTSKDYCPIDYVVCNKAGILENTEIDEYFKFENINADLFHEPINIYDQDWLEFIHTYDNQEQLLQEVPHNPKKSFTTDFGNHYPVILISSRNNIGLTSLKDISLKDQQDTYDRPRTEIEEYIGAELTPDILARINRIRALSCFTGTIDEQRKKQQEYKLITNPELIKCTIIGDDWCIIVSTTNKYGIFFANYSDINKKEVKQYLQKINETYIPSNPQDLIEKDIVPIKDDIKIYIPKKSLEN